MRTISRSIDIDASPAQVFAAVTDWDRHGTWMLLTKVRPTRGSGHAPGDSMLARTGVGPLAMPDSMTITRWDPPWRCDVVHEGRVVRGTGHFLVAELPGGRSRFIWTEVVDPPLGRFGAAALVLGSPVVNALLDLCLRRLARWAPTR